MKNIVLKYLCKCKFSSKHTGDIEMFTVYIEKDRKPLNKGTIKASGQGFFDGQSTMYNSGTNGAWTCNSNFSAAEIFVNGKSVGVYPHGARIIL